MAFYTEGVALPAVGLQRMSPMFSRFLNRTGDATVKGELLMVDRYANGTNGVDDEDGSRLRLVDDPDDHPCGEYVVGYEAAAAGAEFKCLVVGYTEEATVTSDDGARSLALGDILYIDTADAQVGANELAAVAKGTVPPAGKLIVGEIVETPSFTAATGKPKIYFDGLSQRIA